MVGTWRSSRVAVLYGGVSDEREVSIKTGEAFHFALLSLGYKKVEMVDATGEGLLKLASNPPDVALLALHGGLGENGSVQGMLECLKVPYTGSGVHGCATAMNKDTAKSLFRMAGLPTPDWQVLDRARVEQILSQPDIDAQVPCVVKPVTSGSSVGVTLVREADQYYGALEAAMRCPGPVMIEALIEGRELTVGLMDGQVMGIIEIAPDRNFYDYKAKYQDPKTNYLMPAPIPDRLQQEIGRLVQEANRVLGCRGVVRADLMLDAEDRPWLLEVNTTPGMTETSLVPKLARGSGIEFEQFTEMMLDNARLDADLQYG